MRFKVIALICITSTWSLTAKSQSTTIDINAANPQRTRVLKTKELRDAPTKILWKSEKLFHYRASDWVTGETGPFRFSIDLPTNQSFSVPIIAGDLLCFTYVATDGYLFAIEKATGQKVIVLQLEKNSVSRPAANENIVFFGSARGQVHAYDVRKREKKWSFLDKDHSFAESYPILYGDLLYIYAMDRGLYAPVIADELLYVRCRDNKLYALSTATLTEVWQLKNGNSTPPAPVFADGVMYSLGSDGFVHAIK